MPDRNPLRELPSVDQLLADERLQSAAERHGRAAALQATRAALARAREDLQAGFEAGDLPQRVIAELDALLAPKLRRVLNATGVIVHTNLGRAPLAPEALERVIEVARGYSNLEYDLEDGARGSRQDHLAAHLRELTGAEAALVVNNNAAAVLLALAALAEGREVIVSRGELVEIGDGFRIPEVLARSGAKLVEVGTTNRTYVRDYAAAITFFASCSTRISASAFIRSRSPSRARRSTSGSRPSASRVRERRGRTGRAGRSSGGRRPTGRIVMTPLRVPEEQGEPITVKKRVKSIYYYHIDRL